MNEHCIFEILVENNQLDKKEKKGETESTRYSDKRRRAYGQLYAISDRGGGVKGCEWWVPAETSILPEGVVRP